MTDTHFSFDVPPPTATAGPIEPHLVSSRTVARIAVVSAALLGDCALIGTVAILIGADDLWGFQVGDGGKLLVAAVPLYLFVAWACGAYRLETLRKGSASSLRALVSLSIACCLSFFAIFSVGPSAFLEQGGLIAPFAAAAPGLAALRWGVGTWLLSNGRNIEPDIILLGDDSVRTNQDRGATTQIDVRANAWRPLADSPSFLDDLSRTVGRADRIVLSFRTVEERLEWGRLMSDIGLRVEVLEPQLAEMKPLALGHLGSTPTLVISRDPLTIEERMMKRAFDLVLVGLVMPVALPLACILALLVRLDSPGPVLFVQKRIGVNNRYFSCLKFRTMRADLADEAGKHLTERNDPRITRIGSFLRRTSLDELPQLWNVLKGDMSIVGPRPHALGASAGGALYWEAVQGYWRRHSVKPGLTGLAQIRGYRGPTETISEIENRVAADLEYINSWSLWLDIKILFRTVKVLVHQNAF